MTKQKSKKKLWRFVQFILPFLRNEPYYNERIEKRYDRLSYLIKRDTPWLEVTTSRGKETFRLPFNERAVKYFEYKNMRIQQTAQYVIIFLTAVLLLMTSFQVYMTFFYK